jgi:hypothetical protein
MSVDCQDPVARIRLRDYVLGTLQEPERVACEDHLAGCPRCAAELLRLERSLQRLGADAEREPSFLWSAWSTRPGPTAAVAAAAVLLVLGYPAFLGLYRLPRIEKQMDALAEQQSRSVEALEARLEETRQASARKIAELAAAALPGIVEIHYLARPQRGGAPAATVRIASGEALVLLGVELESAGAAPDSAVFRFELSSDGREVWSGSLKGNEVRQFLDSPQGVILLRIPSADLPDGPYLLRVQTIAASRTETVLLQQFRISR